MHSLRNIAICGILSPIDFARYVFLSCPNSVIHYNWFRNVNGEHFNIFSIRRKWYFNATS